MATKTLRRRLHHGDVDGRKQEHFDTAGSDGLSEPLLGKYGHDDSYSEAYVHENHQEIWDERRRERLHWTFLFSQLIAQWAQWLANIVIGSGSFLGRLLSLPFIGQNGSDRKNIPLSLSPLQEERLRNLQQRLEVPFDGTRLEHQDALRQLWRLAYADRELPSLKSELWKEMGWQGPDPSTDFRGGGFISLENLIFFAKKYPDSFQRLLHKQEGRRAEWEYPFAIAGINISFMLAQMLDLQSGRPTSLAGVRFLELLGEDEMAFDNLYCVSFQMMDAQWLAKRASYMEFNVSTMTLISLTVASYRAYKWHTSVSIDVQIVGPIVDGAYPGNHIDRMNLNHLISIVESVLLIISILRPPLDGPQFGQFRSVPT